jgi:hypothetical protein
MVTDALSLRCVKSPLMLTCAPQEEQISSAANATGAQSHKPMSVVAQMANKATGANPEPFKRVSFVSLFIRHFLIWVICWGLILQNGGKISRKILKNRLTQRRKGRGGAQRI